MGVMDEKLWMVLEAKAREEDQGLRPDRQIHDQYMAAMREISQFGVDRAKMIRDTFPMYTLHDETHICNVMRIMADLLGGSIDDLRRDEVAMLILAACCHDIGMSYSEDEKRDILWDTDRLNQYLERNHGEYVKAYAVNPEEPNMTDEMLQKYLRSIHHERVVELLAGLAWPDVLRGKVDRDDLVRICQSHGEDASRLRELEPTATVDQRLCAILLRLADILDFDTSRAPKAVYDYSGLELAEGSDAKISREEWHKHMASQGFDFCHVADRSIPYELPFHATSHSMQIEQTVNSYLDWADQELDECAKVLHQFVGKWDKLVLPLKIKRSIKAEGYVSGQYRLTLDQDQIMDLLVGKDLYSDPSVFIRELIQNAIDAVRTREQLDKGRPKNWKPQINIRTWMDEAGYHWFRIEDNGTGMTEEIIENFFLKIGRSYYTSDTFQKEKIRQGADPNYMPISRFGIGILSCFMGDEGSNQVEVSTKHFGEGGDRPSALRLSMHGMNGYYYMASQRAGHQPGSMKGVTDGEKRSYLQQPGTVIAVRTNLYQTGKYRGFKEIVDRYVLYPTVPIHYEGPDGVDDYMTEAEFMKKIHQIKPAETLAEEGRFEFSLTTEQWGQVLKDAPELRSVKPPKLILKCVALDHYTKSPYLSGVFLTAAVENVEDAVTMTFGPRKVTTRLRARIADSEDDQYGLLRLEISLDFPSDFENEMRLIENKRQYGREIPSETMRRLFIACCDDPIAKEIMKALLCGHLNDPDWERHMCTRVSEEMLKRKVKAVKQTYQRITGQAFPEENEYKAYREFERLTKKWKFLVCDLSEFPWYRDCFQKTFDRITMRGVTAHNGIVCGSSDYFCSRSDVLDTCHLGTMIFLKDKYRPSVDVARIGVRQLTIEAASDLALIHSQIANEGFTTIIKENGALNIRPWSIPTSAYYRLLDDRPDFTERLLFPTDRGELGIQEVAKAVAEGTTVGLNEHPKLSGRTFWYSTDFPLHLQLCFAYLKRNYALQFDFKQYGGMFYVSGRRSTETDGAEELFSPTFFLPPREKASKYLARKSADSRYSCNRDHRFSRFILKNARVLNEKVPGILTELIRVLAEEEGEQLVDKINSALICLRDLPGQPIQVPDNVFLKNDDLY